MIMKKYDESVRTNHDPKWTYILNILHKILIIAGSGSGKTNVLLNLLKHQRPDVGESIKESICQVSMEEKK